MPCEIPGTHKKGKEKSEKCKVVNKEQAKKVTGRRGQASGDQNGFQVLTELVRYSQRSFYITSEGGVRK